MVCDDVRRIAYFFLDEQLETTKHKDIEGHLTDCPGCDGRIKIHRRLRAFVRARLRARCLMGLGAVGVQAAQGERCGASSRREGSSAAANTFRTVRSFPSSTALAALSFAGQLVIHQ